MTIKKRLVRSYILMLVIPVILILIAGSIYNNKIKINDQGNFNKKFITELIHILSQEPDLLLKQETIQKLQNISQNDEIVSINVKKNDQTVISSNIKNYKYKFGPIEKHFHDPDASWNFIFSDGSFGEVSISLLNSNKNKINNKGKLIPTLSVILILVLTNGILSFFVSTSIIKPINKLKDAAYRIKDEDLETPIIYEGDDEFVPVFDEFEEMRIRLKKSLNEQLKYEESRKELLANISHDLKTPITAIKGYIEGIKDGVADNKEKQEKYLETIYNKSILMNKLIDQLFLFSKLDLNQIHFNFEKIKLGPFINDIINELKFDYKNMEIEMNIKEDLFISGDSIQLHRVISNIIENSNKYCDKEKLKVKINTCVKNKFVEISIEDNGKGIHEDELDIIFDRFYRSDPARSSQKDGTGLGLAIAKQIISSHGGSIWAKSKQNKGTTIFFTLKVMT